MSNQRHLDILKQGMEVWNRWREETPQIFPDLSYARLSGKDLRYANLSGSNLNNIDLMGAALGHADLRGALAIDAEFSEADLSQANLSQADLNGAHFYLAELSLADLSGAALREADVSSTILRGAILFGADLFGANLFGAHLSGVDMREASLDQAVLKSTIFVAIDLSATKGLETVKHNGPSSISVDTLVKSKGRISEAFLRGCGLSDWEIESAKLYNPDLSNEEINDLLYRIHDLRVQKAIQISPLFISYSHADSSFVDTIEKYLIEHGVRFWRDNHHAKAGRLETQIDTAIHHNDVVLLILSEHSTNSDWVEHEARKAREKEKQTGKDALCPVALDDAWKTCRWPARLREQIMEYNILDFSNWQDDAYFQKMFGKLLEGLNLFYK